MMRQVFYHCATAINQTIKITFCHFPPRHQSQGMNPWPWDDELSVLPMCCFCWPNYLKKTFVERKTGANQFFFLQKVWTWSSTCTLNIFTLGVNKLVRLALKNGWQLYFLQVNCLVTTQWPNATKRCLCVNVKPECFLQKIITFLW
jgi:hypothetical protein